MKQRKLTQFYVQEILERKNIRIFTPEEFKRIFGVSFTKAKYFLETYAKKGFFTRLKRGIYAMKNQMPSEEEIANAMYRPSYISFEYALARYGIIPEMVYTLTSVTTKPTRRFSTLGKEFEYLTVKKIAFSGYSLVKEENRSFLIAEPEKALADYLYFVSLGKKALPDRMNLRKLRREKILSYAELFRRKKLFNLVKNL